MVLVKQLLKRYSGTIISALVWGGIEVSPYESLPLAIVLWFIAGLWAIGATALWIRDKMKVVETAPQSISRETSHLSDYTSEWEHFDKIKEAVLEMQTASLEETKRLLGVIQRERVYLDDVQLQSVLENLVFLVGEWAKLGVTPEGFSPLIPKVISGISNRMHKRYGRG